MPQMQNSKEEISVLVCLSGSPSNQKVIRAAARFARGNHKYLTALFVDNGRVKEDDRNLKENRALAESLGASVVVLKRRDVLDTIVAYAQEHAVTDLFIGYSGPARKEQMQQEVAYRLVRNLPDVDVHIIPDAVRRLKPSLLENKEKHRLSIKDFLITAGVMSAATLLSVLVDRSRFSNGNIITIYILAVLITSVLTADRVYGLVAAALYILLFNFLFIDPRFSFLVYDPDYMVTYFVSIIAAIIIGNISSLMKQSTLQARNNAYQAQILLNASEQLQRAANSREIADITTSQLQELMGRQILFYPVKNRELDPEDAKDDSELAAGSPVEYEAVRWTLEHNERAGWGTRHFPEARYQYLSVRTGSDIYGVIAVSADQGELSRFEENILLSLIGECALSLEGEKNRREREEAQIVAENERLRSKLLRSLSHDLRTPLTSIYGNAATLTEHAGELSTQDKDTIYTDIYEDSVWLIDLVENLLAITRLEQSVKIHPVAEVVSDVLNTAVTAASRHKKEHNIILEKDPDSLMAYMDVPLILQVVNNLIANGVKHTPAHTTIRIRNWREGQKVMVSVADDGPGIPDEEKVRIFDLFYTGNKLAEDKGRSLGLGLNLCRSILEAHGETIRAEDAVPHGTVFIFSLALAEGTDDETV